MPIAFDFANPATTEFGLGVNDGEREVFSVVPVDASVQRALREMAQTTIAAMDTLEEDPGGYQPSEKYAGEEYLQVPLAGDFAEQFRLLHQAANLEPGGNVLGEPENIFCYFARMTDGTGHRLTGLRKAGQFKGILKSRNRLIRFVADALRMVEDDVFRLDRDFDVLIDDAVVHVLRPKSFVMLGKLQAAILRAVPENVGIIQRDLPYIDFAPVREYASAHARAAGYLASIKSQPIREIPRRALVDYCRANRIEVEVRRGIVSVPHDQVLAFLRVLDRRRYSFSLVPGAVELYEATGRRQV